MKGNVKKGKKGKSRGRKLRDRRWSGQAGKRKVKGGREMKIAVSRKEGTGRWIQREKEEVAGR